MHRNIAVRAVGRAESAADAVVLDHNLYGSWMILARLAMDRVDRTAHKAVGIKAGAARTGDEKILEPQALADQPRDALVRVGTSPRAFIAPRTAFEVEHQ